MWPFRKYYYYSLIKDTDYSYSIEVFAPSSAERVVKPLRFLIDTGCDISWIKNSSIVANRIDCERKHFPSRTVGINNAYIDSTEMGFIHIVNTNGQISPYVPFIILNDTDTDISYDGILGISFLENSVIDLRRKIVKCPQSFGKFVIDKSEDSY